MKRPIVMVSLISVIWIAPAAAQQEDLVARARSALESGNVEEALRLARRATRSESENVEAWVLLGRANLTLIEKGLVETRGNGAVRAFTRVIELNPSYTDAYLMRGIAYLEGLQDSVRAGADFERQLEADPGHPEASLRLLCLAVDMREFELAESMASAILVEMKDDRRIYRPLLKLYLTKKEWGPAALVARRFLSILPPNERETFYDISPLLTRDEMEVYRALDADARSLYRKRYWARRGGTALDGYATRFIEHIWRVAEARELYGGAKYPWDIRGELLVRYGPPDFRVTSTSGLSLNIIMDGDFQSLWREKMLFLGLPFETDDPTTFFNTDFEPPRAVSRYSFWIYKYEGLLFVFRDPSVGNVMQLTSDSEAFNNAMRLKQPVISRLEEYTIPLEPTFQIAQFRGGQGKTKLHAYFSIPVSEVVGAVLDSIPSENLISQVALVGPDEDLVADVERIRTLQAGPATEVQRSRRFVEAISFEAAPGDYSISAFMAHRMTHRYGSVGPEEIVLRDFSGRGLMMSDLVLASADTLGRSEQNLRQEGLTYIPQPSAVFDLERPFTVYFEVYNIPQDLDGISEYDLTYEIFPEPGSRTSQTSIYSSVAGLLGGAHGDPIISLTSTNRSLRPHVVHRPALSLEGHEEGLYRLRVTVKDSMLGTEVSRETTFLVLYKNPPGR